MKIVIVWSSPNTDGLTATAKQQIIKGISYTENEIKEIHLNRLHLEHCRACGNGFGLCQKSGACVLKDDFQDVYNELQNADGIIWISAVYWHDITECMKAFFDRLRRCETAHNRLLHGKRCLLVACAGGTGLGAIECLYHMEQTLSHMGMRAYDRLPIIRYNKEYMLDALVKAGKTYADCIVNGFDMQY